MKSLISLCLDAKEEKKTLHVFDAKGKKIVLSSEQGATILDVPEGFEVVIQKKKNK